MKHHIFLNSFLLVAFLYAFTTPVFASSEVIGTLSSSGNGSEQNTGVQSSNPEESGTPDNGIIAGNVSGSTNSNTSSGGSSSNGNRESNSGDVLGENTMAVNSSPDILSPDGSALEPPPSAQPDDYGTGVSEDEDTTPLPPDNESAEYGSSSQVATIFGAFSQFSVASWFWIILLTFLLIMVITYIYNHNKKQQARSMKLHF